MLATWLLDNFLAKLNELEDAAFSEGATIQAENLKVEREMLQDDLADFLQSYVVSSACGYGQNILTGLQDCLNQNVVFDLLASHGREDIFLSFCSIVGAHERLLDYYLGEEAWSKAVDVLNRQDSLELYYKAAPSLIRNETAGVIDAFMKQSKLDVRRLLPALLPIQPLSESATEHILRYLEYNTLNLQNRQAAVHNAIISLHARPTQSDEQPLLDFLQRSVDDPDTGLPAYDLDFALRTCHATHRIQSATFVYDKMRMWESAVDYALEHGHIHLAQASADKATEESDVLLRKKLWLKIAKHVVQTKAGLKEYVYSLHAASILLNAL